MCILQTFQSGPSTLVSFYRKSLQGGLDSMEKQLNGINFFGDPALETRINIVYAL